MSVEGWHERAVRLRNAPEKPERFKAKVKPKPKKKSSWRMETRWMDRPAPRPDDPAVVKTMFSVFSEWRGKAYRDEKGARQAFEHEKLQRSWVTGKGARLINPEGVVVEEYTIDPVKK